MVGSGCGPTPGGPDSLGWVRHGTAASAARVGGLPAGRACPAAISSAWVVSSGPPDKGVQHGTVAGVVEVTSKIVLTDVDVTQ